MVSTIAPSPHPGVRPQRGVRGPPGGPRCTIRCLPVQGEATLLRWHLCPGRFPPTTPARPHPTPRPPPALRPPPHHLHPRPEPAAPGSPGRPLSSVWPGPCSKPALESVPSSPLGVSFSNIAFSGDRPLLRRSPDFLARSLFTFSVACVCVQRKTHFGCRVRAPCFSNSQDSA